MSDLKDYTWDTRYSSATHHLINDFFVPALSRSRFYYRIAGYFASTAIAAAFRGISSFVENGEKMFLVIGSELSKEDAEAINSGLKMVDEAIYKKWEECKNDFGNNVIKKRFELLAWLVSNGKIEIKIGVNKDKDGRYLSSDESKFHEKILIFEDYEGNMIQVDGSINETWMAWKRNRESFCVHKSWVTGNEEFIITAKEEFDKVWRNLDETCEIMELPEALRLDIIKIAPKHRPTIDDEVEFEQELEEEYRPEEKNLWRYQQEAIEAWESNGRVGLLEMATGTGKTFVALRAVKGMDPLPKTLIIGVPQQELAKQWMKECEDTLFDVTKRIVPCYTGTGWRSNIAREIRQAERENALLIIISVFGTMRKHDFIEAISKRLGDCCLIIDEVHEVGATKNMEILNQLSEVKVRIGLSATPERLWDEYGNKVIEEYFNAIERPTFVWGMDKAINPPQGYERCLSPYEYHVHECPLEEEELADYDKLRLKINQKISILMGGRKVQSKDVMDDPSLQILLLKRAKIMKKCRNKLRVLNHILDNHKDSLKKCLIYCNDKNQMDEVVTIIMDKGLRCRKFFGEMFSEERDAVFKAFKEDVQFLVAIKCLDQGVDLPFCDSAIILASSKNPREYVQRRGRILRLHKDKEYAIVHDIIVFPYDIEDLKSGKKKIQEYEAQIIHKQLQRMKIFTDNCKNKAENYLKIIEYGDIIINSVQDYQQNG